MCNSSRLAKPLVCHLTCALKDTYSPAQRPSSSMGSLSTLCCSTAVKYWLSPPSCRTPVDLVILCHPQPQYIIVVVTSVLCFTLPPCNLTDDLAESYRVRGCKQGESCTKFMLVTIKVHFNEMKSLQHATGSGRPFRHFAKKHVYIMVALE